MRATVMSTKGGAGKSTLACLLSCEFRRRGKRVLTLDCDPQGTALNVWASRREAHNYDGPTVTGAGDNVASVIRAQAPDYGVVIVDTPGRMSGRAAMALGASDIAIVPVVPGGPGLDALAATMETIAAAQAVRENHGVELLRVGLVANMVRKTALHRIADTALRKVPGATYLGSLRLSADVDLAMSSGTECPLSSQASLDLRAIADAMEALAGEVCNVA
jgi:cellulose biosynthesis protein BcsQ